MKECPVCGGCREDELLNCPEDGSLLEATLEGASLIDKKYLLLRCLGKGGMGSVYLAQHLELQKNFALKLIQHSSFRDPQALARFRNEATALGKLQHPNIVEVTDYGVDPRSDGLPYLVMEYLRGRTLLRFTQDEGPQGIEQVLPILRTMAGALDYAHSHGILHRDLNPKNVFLAQTETGASQIKILDFGLARIIDEPLAKEDVDNTARPGSGPRPGRSADVTQTLLADTASADPLHRHSVEPGNLTQVGVIMGTPGYIAPEIYRGRGAVNASDVYSFGVIAYEMLVGKRPYKDPLRAFSVQARPAPPSAECSSIPEDLDSAILAPLDDEPARRPDKAVDVVGGIQKAHDKYRYRVWRAKELPRRVGMAAALTLTMILLFLVLRGLPLFRNMENALADLYFRWLPSHAPADSLLLVSFDEATLQSDPTLLVNKADEMGIQLQRVFDAGARGIALDFLLPESWGQSESFARLILNNQERFVLASYIKEDGSLLGTECLRGLVMAALGSEDRAAALFGFLNVPPDPDGRIRRVDLGFNNRKGQMPLSMPVKAYQVLSRKIPTREQVKGPFRLDFSTDWTKFQKISWKDLPSLVDHKPDMLLNKMVFIGGEYEGSQDVHRIPKRPGFPDEISGLLIQALALDTLVQNTNVHQVRGVPALIPLAVLFFIFAAFFLTRRKLIPPGALFFALLLGYIFWAVFSFRQNHQLVLIGTPLVVMLMSLTAGLFIRRRLTFLAKPSA